MVDTSSNARDWIEEARSLFGAEPRPEHFTNYRHCDECDDHDQTLLNATPDSITLEELRPSWDPICFITPEGFRYYFPGLMRLAINGTGHTYYIEQFLFHLVLDGPENARWQAFSPEQRAFVVRVLEFLLEYRAAEIESNGDADQLFYAIEIWSQSGDE